MNFEFTHQVNLMSLRILLACFHIVSISHSSADNANLTNFYIETIGPKCVNDIENCEFAGDLFEFWMYTRLVLHSLLNGSSSQVSPIRNSVGV